MEKADKILRILLFVKTKQFQRTRENFTCEHCGAEVTGTGYTNHCPACLWSKHVDINPGDRAEVCQGLMKPAQILLGEPQRILHRCIKCGHERPNKVSPEDDFDKILGVMKGA